MMSPCVLVCGVGDAYKDRVVFFISNRFVYTYYYVDGSPTLFIYFIYLIMHTHESHGINYY